MKGGGGAVPLSLSNFFDSDNNGLRQPLSLSKKFDSDNGCLNPTLEQFFRLILMSNFLVQQQGGIKNTQKDKQWIPTVLLYLFNIRMAILEGASKSSTAFFTVYTMRNIV